MKYLIPLIIAFISSSALWSQTDDIEKWRKQSLEMLHQYERAFRTDLDSMDSISIGKFKAQLEGIQVRHDLVISDMMQIIRDTFTPMVYAEELAVIISGIKATSAIDSLLQNINILKFDDREPSAFDKIQSPCFKALLTSGRFIEIYDILLNKNFFQTFRKVEIDPSIGLTTLDYFVVIFRQHPKGIESLKCALANARKSREKKNLQYIYDRLK